MNQGRSEVGSERELAQAFVAGRVGSDHAGRRGHDQLCAFARTNAKREGGFEFVGPLNLRGREVDRSVTPIRQK